MESGQLDDFEFKQTPDRHHHVRQMVWATL